VPSLSGTRGAATHHIFANNDNHRDDWLDSFYLQSTSQLDGLRHFRHPVHGFYGGVTDDRVEVGRPDIGIQLASERAVVGRGVLVDLPAYFRDAHIDYDVGSNHAVTPDDLDGALARQHVVSEPGDVVVLYTGWAHHFLGLPPDARDRQRGISPGLDQSDDVLAWLWDHRVALLAADNSSVEAYPVHPHSPFFFAGEAAPTGGADHRGLMHRHLLGLLGLLLGELWQLEPLVTACRDDGRYEFLVSVTPLNVIGAVGSPANAIAVK
jgi:kynurenine formamidase